MLDPVHKRLHCILRDAVSLGMGNAGQSWQKADITPDAIKPADGEILGNLVSFFLECLHTIVRNFVIEADERGIAERSQKTGDPPFVKRLTADGALNDPDTFLI